MFFSLGFSLLAQSIYFLRIATFFSSTTFMGKGAYYELKKTINQKIGVRSRQDALGELSLYFSFFERLGGVISYNL